MARISRRRERPDTRVVVSGRGVGGGYSVVLRLFGLLPVLGSFRIPTGGVPLATSCFPGPRADIDPGGRLPRADDVGRRTTPAPTTSPAAWTAAGSLRRPPPASPSAPESRPR